MAGEPQLTLIGNLTADPEIRYTASGQAVTNFTVASTPRTFNRQQNEWVDGETLYVRCSVWREMAENVAESLAKGMRVVVTGRLGARSYETRDGEKRTNWELDVDEVGPSLRYATAKVTRTPRPGGGEGGAYSGPPSTWPDRSSGSSSTADAWSGDVGGWQGRNDEPAF